MASSNFTTHYSIPTPLGTDLTTPMDYNEAAEAVDTALFGAVTDAGNAAEAASEAINTANTASEVAEDVRSDLALEKAKIVQLQTRMTAAENDIDDVYTDVTDMITAYKEPSATSTHAYAIGDYFIYNEILYKATATIAIGATIVPNTNCEATNVSTELNQLNSDLSTVGSVAGDGTVKTIEFTVPADTREVYVRLNYTTIVHDTVIIKKLSGLRYNNFDLYGAGSTNMGRVNWDDTANTVTVITTADLANSSWVISIDAH